MFNMLSGGLSILIKKDEKEVIINKVNQYLSRKPEISMAYLYGSYAKGNPRSHSDIDVAVYFDQITDDTQYPYGYRADLISSLIKLLGTNKIDLIIINDAPIYLRYQVIRYGTLIFTRSEAKRIEFHTDTIRKYLDVKYLLNIQRQFMSRRLAEGTYGKR